MQPENPLQPNEQSAQPDQNGQPPASGQPAQPISPMSRSQFEQLYDQQPSRWRYFFIVLGILQAIGVVAFFLIMSSAIRQAKAGVSGTEYIGLWLFATLVPAVGIIAFINLVGLPIFIFKHRPRGKWLVFCIVSLVVSAILAVYGAYSVYQLRVAIPNRENKIIKQLGQEFEAKQQRFEADNAKPEITKNEAIKLLKTCQLKGFYYTGQTDRENGGWGELSSTGVVLTKIDGKPYRISIADKLVSKLVPVARGAQKTCGGPQFWHDGSYEQWQNGHWYFKDKIVN